jgi:hypothetical protein
MADILAVAFVDGQLGVPLVVVRSKSSPGKRLYRTCGVLERHFYGGATKWELAQFSDGIREYDST